MLNFNGKALLLIKGKFEDYINELPPNYTDDILGAYNEVQSRILRLYNEEVVNYKYLSEPVKEVCVVVQDINTLFKEPNYFKTFFHIKNISQMGTVTNVKIIIFSPNGVIPSEIELSGCEVIEYRENFAQSEIENTNEEDMDLEQKEPFKIDISQLYDLPENAVEAIRNKESDNGTTENNTGGARLINPLWEAQRKGEV